MDQHVVEPHRPLAQTTSGQPLQCVLDQFTSQDVLGVDVRVRAVRHQDEVRTRHFLLGGLDEHVHRRKVRGVERTDGCRSKRISTCTDDQIFRAGQQHGVWVDRRGEFQCLADLSGESMNRRDGGGIEIGDGLLKATL